MPRFPLLIRSLPVLGCLVMPMAAQDNYEIQVYGSETVAPHTVMAEIHSNFTFEGTKSPVAGVWPTNHALHETLEITAGLNSWAELGWYLFTANTPGYGYNFVGTHIRPRVRAPESWHWPVGVSVSTEFGYQRAMYSSDTWNWEIRPIIDRELGHWYLCFNPTVGKSIHGLTAHDGWDFSPNFKFSYDVTRRVKAGLEYYGSLGPIGLVQPFRDQGEQLIPALDVDFGPQWEFNLGVGVGITQATDHLLVKMIIGRRFNFHW